MASKECEFPLNFASKIACNYGYWFILLLNCKHRVIGYGAIQIIVPRKFPIGSFPIYLTTFQTNNAFQTIQRIMWLKELRSANKKLGREAKEYRWEEIWKKEIGLMWVFYLKIK